MHFNLINISNEIDQILLTELKNYNKKETINNEQIYTLSIKDFNRLKYNLNQRFPYKSQHYDNLTYQIYFTNELYNENKTNKYKIHITLLRDYEYYTHQIPFITINVDNKKHFKIKDIENKSLHELLIKTQYEDELSYFIKELAEYEAECTLNEDWLNFEETYLQNEIKYYKSLSDNQRIAYAKSHGYSYARSYLFDPLKELFRFYDLDFINTLFKNIEFK